MCIDGDYLERKASRRYRITARHVGIRLCARNFPDNLVGAARQPVICELPMDKDDSLRIRERRREREVHEDKCCETRRQVGRRDKRKIERKRERGGTRRVDNLPSSLRATSWQPEGLSPRRRRTETTWVNLCENLSSCLRW